MAESPARSVETTSKAASASAGWLSRWPVLAAVGGAVGLKAGLLLLGLVPFNSDEAVVGLMARHILQGNIPVFFYGQAYLGSLDALLVALGFALAGAHVWVIRAVQIILYAGTIVTTYMLAQRVTRNQGAAAAAALLMAVPTVNVTLYTTVSLGGYGEALLIGNLILLVTLAVWDRPHAVWAWLIWGFLCGFGFWVFGLTLVYSLPAAVLMAFRLFRGAPVRRVGVRAGAAAVGTAVGASAWWGWAVQHGPSALLRELGGAAIAGASSTHWLASLGAHVVNLALFGTTVILGLRPPWSVETLVWPLVPLVVAFWLAVLAFAWLRRFHLGGEPPGGWLLLGVAGVLLVAFVASPFGADPSGRYFLPMWVVMAVAGGAMVAEVLRRRGGRWAWPMLSIILAFNLIGTLQAAVAGQSGLTTQFDPVARIDTTSLDELVAFLRVQGETRGYTNYWVAYPLAFASDEDLIYIPRLPYHLDFRYTPRDDRYPPYDAMVAQSPSVAYITTSHPQLDSRISSELAARGVRFSQTDIGPYHVFYGLSQPVRLTSKELGLNDGVAP